ncbi:MAG: alpha-amylase/4-alpha-glucanotransferase domain-containing protein [Campylobacterota bacterium]
MKTSLLFGIHCHQPVDNFSFVVDDAIQDSYLPFFQTLQKHPDIKISVHFSGWLLEYIKQNAPELFVLMQTLSDQIEFFTGGYYEPVLASISSQDRIAQINKLSNFIYKNFKQIPKGLWLTERVWDSGLISDLSECGIDYVILDDYHFKNSYYDSDLNGYYISEDSGKEIAIFPISQKLRYEIPFLDHASVIQSIEEFSSDRRNGAAVIFDDGEKFGVWPKTYELVYEKKWLDEFFSALESSEKIVAQTYREFYKNNKPLGLVYLAPASYEEMGIWSLNYEDAQSYKNLAKTLGSSRYLKGGQWKNFLNKYQESNWIHKRIKQLASVQGQSQKYKDNLYKAQCNDVLWHGVFGGIYLPNLRDNAYRYIIECEKLLESKKLPISYDIDFDGYAETKLINEALLAIFSPLGAQLYELDILQTGFNLQNTMTRYKEHYHSDIEVCKADKKDATATIHKDKLFVDEEVALHYDWYLKKSSIDHISDASFTLESFKANSFKEYGDFANTAYETLKAKRKKVTFVKEGGIYLEQKFPTRIEKSFSITNSTLTQKLSLHTEYDQTLKYISEWNLHFFDYSKLRINGVMLEDSLHIVAHNLTIEDTVQNKRYEFDFESECEVYIVTLETVSQSESGVDTTAQGISIAFIQSFQNACEFHVSFEMMDTTAT